MMNNKETEDRLVSLLQSHPIAPRRLAYGTAGFRDRAEVMGGAIARVGVFACLRSRWCKSKFIGIMITASHNPEPDNGAKLADEDGGMLEEAWEPYIEAFANCGDTAQALALVKDLIQRESIDTNIPAHVVIGRDTRPSSEALWAAACDGVRAVGGTVHDIGMVTTPQLHLVVRLLNEHLEKRPGEMPNAMHELDRYYSILAEGYMSLRGSAASPAEDRVVIDCSFGIGSVSMVRLAQHFDEKYPGSIHFDLRNPSGSGRVNEGCGAELVQKEQTPPCAVTAAQDAGKCVCSFDGDADRIVFHRFNSEGKWYLADGDKIACLLAQVLKTELHRSGLAQSVTFGVVQTAYANGSSTDFLRSHQIPVVFAKTGVKFLHRKAVECFDAAIYFEANGHGTILFSKRFCDAVRAWDGEDAALLSAEQKQTRLRIKALMKVINAAIGDAISDMLAVLACLQVLGMTSEEWFGMYTDLPSKQVKVPVADKDAIKCSADEMVVVSPAELQDTLNAAMRAPSQDRLSRCFVRPSGTENVVRVYAEAPSAAQAAELAEAAIQALQDLDAGKVN